MIKCTVPLSNFHHFIQSRVFIDDCYTWLTLVPLQTHPWSIIAPILRKGSQDPTPKATTQSPYSEFIWQKSYVGSFWAHFDHCVRRPSFLFQVDCSPLGAGSEAVDVKVILSLDWKSLWRLVKTNVVVGAQELKSSESILLDVFSKMRSHRGKTLKEKFHIEDNVILRFLWFDELT